MQLSGPSLGLPALRLTGSAGRPDSHQRRPSGGKLMVDANGNKAYVYPDGRIEEVR